ncbi:MAG: hypothetical protein JWM34_1423 [Ilumatobacteraceae bacterium]|nr:hypothetical protein [Ilumatobacteraceae bacterium]
MAWDSSRPVPWKRLVREWLIYVGIASVAFVIYYLAQGKKIQIGLFVGLMSSGPMYLLFGGVLAKFGYQRKTMKDLRAERAERPMVPAGRGSGRGSSGASAENVRNRPAPTKRTSTGPSQYRKNNKPKRR